MSSAARGAAATAGQTYEESARQLARWRDRYRGRPDRERRRLWLLALEREQVVSIAYRESAIADRIGRMPLAEEVRDLIRHAMVWVWKDEEMHTAYIRGVVLHRGDPVLQAVAYGEQVVGAVSGWAARSNTPSSATRRYRSRWRRCSPSVAGSRASSRRRRAARPGVRPVPPVLRLQRRARAQRRAVLARLVDLAEGDAQREEFAQVRDDEARHGRIFTIFQDALGEDDRLRPGVTADELVEQVREAGEWFLPGRDHGIGQHCERQGISRMTAVPRASA